MDEGRARRRTLPPAAYSSGHILHLVRSGAATSRAEIGRYTGLSRPSVASRVTELLASGLVVEGATGPSRGGRPPSRLEFRAASGLVLTAALGITRSQVAVCDLAGGTLAQAGGAPPLERGPAVVVPWLLDTWRELVGTAGRVPDDVQGVGISLPGTVEFAAGRAEAPPVLGSWGGVEIRPLVQERFPVPVWVDNDVNAMAVGEHRHRPNTDDMIVVKASTGIGAGIITGGHLVRGALGAAGEIGHIPVGTGDGPPCRCGKVGCLEAVAGGAALLARLAERGGSATEVTELAELARDGHPAAVTLVRAAGRDLGEVLAALVNVLNPAVVVLGGDLARAFDHLAAGVREAVFRRCTALATRELRVVPSALDDRAGLLGCAEMVLDEVLAPDAVDARLATAASSPVPGSVG